MIILKKYDAIIIGAGLGGLLSALNLIELGKKVIIFEKLDFLGGRFYNIEYKGYQLSTGAVHMIPHGNNGPLGKMLKRLKVPVEIEPSSVFSSWIFNGKYFENIHILGVFSIFSYTDKLTIAKIIAKVVLFPADNSLSFKEWLSKQTESKDIHLFFDKLIEFSMSIKSEQLRNEEARAFLKKSILLGGPGVIKGGCKSLIDKLVELIESNSRGLIYKNTEVVHIISEDNCVRGIEIKTENGDIQTICSDIIISNCGPKKTIELIDSNEMNRPFIEKISKINQSNGTKIHFSSNISLIEHTGILFTPDAKRIAGIIQPSNTDRTLSPPNKHLLITHQAEHDDLEEDIGLAIDDLKQIFPNFDKECEILSVGRYKGAWPVNYTLQGEEIENQTPIKGLFLVGDGNKSKGFIMTEGLAKGVENTINCIKTDFCKIE